MWRLSGMILVGPLCWQSTRLDGPTEGAAGACSERAVGVKRNEGEVWNILENPP